MARKRKRDFWDDIEDDVVSQEESKPAKESNITQGGYTDADEDEGFKLTKCMPVKVIARILLCVAAAVIALSGYTFYKYVDDRYANGTYTTSYFESNGFSREYNDTIEKLIQALKAIEGEGDVTPERAAELVTGVMGTNGNFSYYVMNEANALVVQSGEDAKDRIEASNHFLRISSIDTPLSVDSGVPTTGLNKNAWQTALDECSNAYQIYTAVDNNLAQQDSFYDSYIGYQKLTDYFGMAKIAGIAAIVVFLILLVFCVMSTGMYKGQSGVRLSWFDRIFTEVALIIILAIVGGLVYGMFYLMGHDMKFGIWLKAADAFLIYIFLIRGYFSLVRRIKSGTFITNAIIYKICHGINMGLNKLPKAIKVIIIVLFLVALNGALVYALLYWRDLTVGGIPLIFIVAPIVFVIELIAFISCIFGVGDEEEYLEDGEEPEALEDHAQSEAEQDDLSGWENVDFSSEIKAAEAGQYEDHSQTEDATVENVRKKAVDKTVVLSQNERKKVLDSLGFGETQMLDTKAVRAAEKASMREPLDHIPDISEMAKPGDKTEIMEPISISFDDSEPKAETVPARPSAKAEPVVKPEPKASRKATGQAGRRSESDTAVSGVSAASAAKAADKTTGANTPSAAKAAAAAGVAGTAAASAAGAGSVSAASVAGAVAASPAETAEALDLVDFIQLNKDVRKLYRVKLKARSIGVTLRAPEKPILLDIDKANAIKVLSILFENIEKYAEEGSRVYIEMYAQNGKMIYLMKNTIRADLLEQTTNAMGRGLMEAKRIVQSEKGKFINSVEGDTYKVGILLDVADV